MIVPGLELAWFLSDEAVALVKSVRSLMTEDGKQEWLAKPWVQQLIGWWNMISFSLLDFKINWKEGLMQGAQKSSSFVVGQVTGVAQNVLLFTVNFFVALFTLFFLLRDGRDFLRKCQRLLPMDREHQQRLLKNIVDAVLAVIHGSFVVAIVQGLLAGLAYWFLGVPFAVLWGVVTGFFALLPVGGSALVSIPASIYLFLQGETLRGIILLAWCLGFVGTIDNVLKPLLIGNRLGLPVLFLFLASLAVFLCSARWALFSARFCLRCCGHCSISIWKSTPARSKRPNRKPATAAISDDLLRDGANAFYIDERIYGGGFANKT